MGCNVKYTVKTHNGWDAEKLVQKCLAPYRYGRYGYEFFKCDLEKICHTIDEVVNSMALQYDKNLRNGNGKNQRTNPQKRKTTTNQEAAYRYVEVSSGDDSGETDNNSTDSDYVP
jgi:hypothetical protein